MATTDQTGRPASDDLRRAVKGTNALTAAWCEVAPPGEFVISGAGAWPLLALLEAGASGRALDELREATGVKPEEASALAVDLMTHLGAIGVDAALALWIRAGARINASWATELPVSAFRELPQGEDAAHAAINRWASEATSGRISDVDVAIHEQTALVLVSALRTAFEWRQPFSLGRVQWLDQEVVGLRRWSAPIDDFGVIDGGKPVARFVSRGSSNIDVHLLSGPPDLSPAAVFRTGIEAVVSPRRCTSAADMTKERDVGALRLVLRETTQRWGTIDMPAFTIRSRHDLLASAGVFGLQTARVLGDHFPRIARELSVDTATQQGYASFQTTGFEAAAVTIMSMPTRARISEPPPRQRYLCAEMVLDRPFGFLVVHQPTQLVLFAGWVTTPVPPEEPEEHFPPGTPLRMRPLR